MAESVQETRPPEPPPRPPEVPKPTERSGRSEAKEPGWSDESQRSAQQDARGAVESAHAKATNGREPEGSRSTPEAQDRPDAYPAARAGRDAPAPQDPIIAQRLRDSTAAERSQGSDAPQRLRDAGSAQRPQEATVGDRTAPAPPGEQAGEHAAVRQAVVVERAKATADMATLSEAPTAQSTQGGGELALGNGQPQDTARASQSPEESRNDEPVTASLSDASATAWRPADQNTTVAEQNTTVADQSTRQQTAGARGSAAEAQARRQAETTGETDDDPPGPPKDAGDLTSVGDGSGPWFDEGTNHREGGAVQQMTEGSCVSASGEMITDGRVTQPELLAELGDWSNLSALRDELNNRDGVGTWTGHYFADGSEALRQASEGPMAAQVQAPFGRAHMVMLEPGENGSFIVRDPYEGSSYDVDSSWVEKYVAGGVFR